MTSKGRRNELKRIFEILSGGGNCFRPKALSKHLGMPIDSTGLPDVVYEEDFI